MVDTIQLILIIMALLVVIYYIKECSSKKRIDKKTGEIILSYLIPKIIVVIYIAVLIDMELPSTKVINDKPIYKIIMWGLGVLLILLFWSCEFRYNGKQIIKKTLWFKKSTRNIKDISEIISLNPYMYLAIRFKDGKTFGLNNNMSSYKIVVEDIMRKIPQSKFKRKIM